MQVKISPQAVEHIKQKGGHLVVFPGRSSGCCISGAVPTLMLDVHRPLQKPENYETMEVSGVTVHLDRELKLFPGTAEVALEQTLWWKSLSLNYREN